MMKTSATLSSVIIPGVLFASVAGAVAQAPDINLVVGQQLPLPSGIVQSAASPYRFYFGGSKFNSYCCTAVADNTQADLAGFDRVPTGPTGGPEGGENRGAVEPLITFGTNTNNEGRLCFTPSETGVFAAAAVAVGGPTSFDNLRVECEETTLYGGYNTAAAPLNFLEITNTTASNVDVLVRAGNALTGQTDVAIAQVTLGPSQRADIDIHSKVTAGSFGAIRINSNAPRGAVVATVSQYKITSTNPLAFELVGRVPFEPRK
jgi:hypothetical protein